MKINEGDYVYVIVESKDSRRREHFFKADRDEVYSTVAGIIRGDDLIGQDWGEILELQAGRAYLLPPTRYEITKFLLKRVSQIIYPKDLGYIIEVSGLMPGMRVVEAGVGSGFLTIMLALVVGREGKVIGYDVKREAIEATKNNLKVLGLLDRVELRLGDIREGMEDEIDGAFLDMPDPWVALKAIHKNLKPGAPAIIFVPTYDQLRKVYRELVEQKLYVIEEAVEILKRDIEIRREAIRPSTQMVGHTGFITLLRRISD